MKREKNCLQVAMQRWNKGKDNAKKEQRRRKEECLHVVMGLGFKEQR